MREDKDGEELTRSGIEEEIEKERQTDRKRKGDIGSEQVWAVGVGGRGETVAPTISGEM